MKTTFTLLVFFVIITLSGFSQDLDKIINDAEVLRIEKTLSADDMQGRKPGTAGIKKAATFIADEFAKAGLEFLPGTKSYYQDFNVYKPKTLSTSATFDESVIKPEQIIVMSVEDSLAFDEKSDFEVVQIAAGAKLFPEVMKLIKAQKKYLVIIDTSYRTNFRRLTGLSREMFSNTPSVIFVLSAIKPGKYKIDIRQEITEIKLSNIVGFLPGKSRKEELVLFSGHYDHIGIGKPNPQKDSIYNGANDDAAGITAVIMLSKFFSKQKMHERSIVFVAFTAEESGGFGSKYFSQQLDPAKTVAMFNIEMIGTESKWGVNSAYITGFEKSDLGSILQKNLEGSKFKFYPDPYPEQQLFYRSDNATLAAQGVPAHTISTSKMDAEPYYHSADDEIETLDLQNMAEIIKSIAISSESIINGKDTPSRVEIVK